MKNMNETTLKKKKKEEWEADEVSGRVLPARKREWTEVFAEAVENKNEYGVES